MFIVYKSNQINILFSKICQIIKKKPMKTPFSKEFFIHDNKILFEWLNMFIANEEGISANFQFYYTHSFIWKIFQMFIPEKKITNIYKTSLMTWNIMNIIEKKNYSHVINIKDNQIKKFKFSFLMAKIFQKYLIYRPQWITMWEKNNSILNIEKHEEWQIKLWNELNISIKKIDPLPLHFTNIFERIKNIKNEKKNNQYNFSIRYFIMSSFSLNPIYIKILKILGQYINIYLLYVTPCKKNIFYNDLLNKKEILNKKYHPNNSLMILWGKYEKIYSFYINSKNTKIINCFKKIKEINLLNMIQNHILNTNNNHKNNKKKIIYPSDHSISINSCYNEKHEIQILYQKIITIFQIHPNILPGDIIVISNKIHQYISFINEIFKSESNLYQIPFCINEEKSKRKNILFSAFSKILYLPYSRFNNEEILNLLETPEIAQKFHISEDEIEIINNWIKIVNIRWGIDKKHKNKLFSIKNEKNTWLYGIKRLLLSYAINQENAIWNNYLSCLSINGSQSKLLGKIAYFIDILDKWRKKLSKPKTFKSWYLLFNLLIDDFFEKNITLNESIYIMRNNWKKITYNGITSNYKKKISIDIIRMSFIYYMNTINKTKFLPGVINFCNPQTVYYIPFKIICILGVNEKNVPRQQKILDINLLHNYQEIGDNNKRLKDLYLFLQSLYAAKKYFYISYIRYSLQKNSNINMSVLIDQLFQYISSNFYFIEDKNLSFENNKKKIIHHFYKYHEYQYNYSIKNTKQKNRNNHVNLLLDQTIYQINYKDLINFWKNPIHYFFKNKFKVNSIFLKEEKIYTEPFEVNTLDSFQLKKNILKKIINNENIEKLFKYYQLSGILPYKYFGKIFLKKQIFEMKKIANLIFTFKKNTQKIEFDLKIKKYHIYGTLSEIQDTGLLRWKPTTINNNDKISLWIEHLIYCSLGRTGESKIIGYNNEIWCFSSIPCETAKKYLLNYVIEYIIGIKKPLFLLKSGASWLNYIYDTKKKYITNNKIKRKTGYLILLDTWNGNKYYTGEKEDLYIKNIISTLNNNNIRKICAISKKWLLPILQNRKK
ncbi:exodeoxyribonuclease V subunit gamma [Buchnera aphidicola]|uniref:exodeoxyribonuclease V subunit gamma n=1 Tax=Buchnera aphidicola TaxID=9 RepID=UPI003BEEBF59